MPVCQQDVDIMALLDKKYTDCPFYGVLRMTTYLQKDEMLVIGKDLCGPCCAAWA